MLNKWLFYPSCIILKQWYNIPSCITTQYRTPLGIVLGAWNSLRHHGGVVCNYIGHFWYTLTTRGYVYILVVHGLAPTRCQAISNHHLDLTMLILHGTEIMLPPLNKRCWKAIGGETLWFLCYWRICLLTAMTCYVMLITCQWKLPKNTSLNTCKKGSTLCNHLYVHENHHSIWWEILILVECLYDRQDLPLNLSCMSYPVHN